MKNMIMSSKSCVLDAPATLLIKTAKASDDITDECTKHRQYKHPMVHAATAMLRAVKHLHEQLSAVRPARMRAAYASVQA